MKARAWFQSVFAGLTAVLTVLTLVAPHWIEAVFGVDPDQRSGTLEWVIVVAGVLVTMTCTLLAHRSWRRVRAGGLVGGIAA